MIGDFLFNLILSDYFILAFKTTSLLYSITHSKHLKLLVLVKRSPSLSTTLLWPVLVLFLVGNKFIGLKGHVGTWDLRIPCPHVLERALGPLPSLYPPEVSTLLCAHAWAQWVAKGFCLGERFWLSSNCHIPVWNWEESCVAMSLYKY